MNNRLDPFLAKIFLLLCDPTLSWLFLIETTETKQNYNFSDTQITDLVDTKNYSFKNKLQLFISLLFFVKNMKITSPQWVIHK